MNTTQGRVLTQLLEAAWKSFTEMVFSTWILLIFYIWTLHADFSWWKWLENQQMGGENEHFIAKWTETQRTPLKSEPKLSEQLQKWNQLSQNWTNEPGLTWSFAIILYPSLQFLR